MKKQILIAVAVIAVLLTGCADATNVQECLPEAEHTYGFWGGLWHGMIVFFDLISQLWWDDVTIYAENNNGGWYDFGFWLGAVGFGGGATKATSKRRK